MNTFAKIEIAMIFHTLSTGDTAFDQISRRREPLVSPATMDENAEIRIKLRCSNDAYALGGMTLAVPARLGRNGLSEVTNHLLGDTPAPGCWIFAASLQPSALEDAARTSRFSRARAS